MAVIVHSMWRPAPHVPMLEEFAARMEQHGLRVHHVYNDPNLDGEGFWTIEIERSQLMQDGGLHMQFLQVSPEYLQYGTSDAWDLVADLIVKEQESALCDSIR